MGQQTWRNMRREEKAMTAKVAF